MAAAGGQSKSFRSQGFSKAPASFINQNWVNIAKYLELKEELVCLHDINQDKLKEQNEEFKSLYMSDLRSMYDNCYFELCMFAFALSQLCIT